MGAKTNYYKIGIFVILAAVLAIASVIVLGVGAIFREEFIVESYFDASVQGLEVGSSIKFRGIPIGKVKSINTVTGEYHVDSWYVLVRSALYPDTLMPSTNALMPSTLDAQVAKGLRVRLIPVGVTGTMYLEVDFLDPKRFVPIKYHWTPEYPVLPSAPNTITRLSEAVDRIMRNLEEFNLRGFTVRLETILDTLTQTIDTANVERVTLEAYQLLSELRETNKIITVQLQGNELKSILVEGQATIKTVRHIVKGSEKSLANLLASLSRTSKSIERMTRKIDALSGEVPQAVTQLRTTLHRLDVSVSLQQQDIEITSENLRIITENLKEYTENTKQYPAHALFGAPPDHIHPGEP